LVYDPIYQRVALSTVVNICKKLPSESPSLFMEAVPILCKLLQYEDRQVLKNRFKMIGNQPDCIFHAVVGSSTL